MPLVKQVEGNGTEVWVFVPRNRPRVLSLSDTTEGLFVLYADGTVEPAQGLVGAPGFYMVPVAAYEFIARATR